MTATTIDAGDGLPLTIPALLRARVESRGASVLLACDDDILTYAAAEHRSAALARGLLAAGAGKGTHVGILHPNGSEFVVAWLAAARIGAVSVPLSTFSTSAELRVLLRNADVALLLSASSYRSHDYAAVLRGAVPELDFGVPPPLFAGSLPVLRHVAFVEPGARRRSGLVHAMDRGARAVDRAQRPRGGGSGGQRRRPAHHRAHLGLDRRAEGRDPHARRVDPPPRQPEPDPPLHARRGAVLQLAVLLDRRARLLAPGHARRRRPTGLLERSARRRRARRPRARAADDGQRVRPVRRPSAARPELRPTRPVLDSARQPLPDHAGRRPTGEPRPAPRDARHDGDRQRVPGERRRVRPARAPARILRPPRSRIRSDRRRSRHRRDLWFRPSRASSTCGVRS